MTKQTIEQRSIEYDSKNYKEHTLRSLYKGILKPRLIEEKMLAQLRLGKISKWFAGIGQEAIAVGATQALHSDEYVFTMHRNLGVFTTREVPLRKLFAQWQGKKSGFSKGRDRSFHFGAPEYHIIGMISHVAAMLSVADGIGLAHRLQDEGKIALAFTGEGATSEGEFHEALNVAAVWELPVIFLVENNGYALSTPTNEQYKCEKLSDRAEGYGMEGYTIDGNNVLEVYDTVNRLASSMRKKPRPVLLECETFRMRGHEEASGTKYVPDELFDKWGKKDPVDNYESFLLEKGWIKENELKNIREQFKEEIKKAWEEAYQEDQASAHTEEEIKDLYLEAPASRPPDTNKTSTQEQRYIDAVSEGLYQSMEDHDNLILMGQDIAEHGGVFKVTQGFVEQFGKDRVRNTPLCEAAIVGAGLGLSVKNWKSVIEMQFADFVTCAFNQVVNNLAKTYYRWQQNADVVIRMPTGGGVGAGPFHSQSTEAWFFNVPGLKIVYPAYPADAKGLLMAAIEDPNPVLFYEHKKLYRSVKGEVPETGYTLPIGQAQLVEKGEEISIITYGWGVHWAREIVKEKQVSADVLDLRTLLPYDKSAIDRTVKKTNKVIILHEDTLTGGIGGDISAYINEHLFEYLDGPVLREGSLDTPVPFAEPLEKNFLPRNRFEEKLEWLIDY